MVLFLLEGSSRLQITHHSGHGSSPQGQFFVFLSTTWHIHSFRSYLSMAYEDFPGLPFFLHALMTELLPLLSLWPVAATVINTIKQKDFKTTVYCPSMDYWGKYGHYRPLLSLQIIHKYNYPLNKSKPLQALPASMLLPCAIL